jgi:hypothetical protein
MSRVRRLFLYGGVAVAFSTVLGGTAAVAGTQARRGATGVLATSDPGGHGYGVSVADGHIRLASGGSEVAVETVAARRGDSSVDATVRGSERSTPELVTIERAGFVETVHQSPGGVEQSWHFQKAPGRSGDLSVSVAVPNLDYVATTVDGLVLRRARTLTVLYGNGTWIDAAGHRSPVPARYLNGRIELTVLADVVARTPYPAVLDPKIVVTPITQ